ncbi:MAG: bifunctional UDP-N-acetylglucosamine diphosphorylase/glucosamine-1-phosphate N-acetyltransferase GlmU [Cycloclasticus sp.]|uniref:bifunctional UDP-N-acetylglucosamine diphosphorylase/glucosamine-1-phosphate N-acetyltransferase GlmU n=1 Tax=Cycloclasticus sp. TaxID=2024830 RepID=UPI00257F0B38|nr:bifunctional UDP-N-acetylglucosamine diphosphorylase/glucosamine-1-phosphate N-acetyltransferase GlmU [Cycloclasticus sp.]MBV1899815.1 bifunctional UDP-N-acetylglucosamine diphosphorylase/glucosamine-1-phosphate N-acetyltransferase GlmU [Cycloclasticus sp.]
MNIKTIVLAAGKGTRMKSNKAKVLHQIGGKPMLQHVIESARPLSSEVVVVYGHDGEEVKKKHSQFDINWVEQIEQLGTGHAVKQASHYIAEDDIVLILYGDVPLINSSTLHKLITHVDTKSMSLLTVTLENPMGYGRIVREGNKVCKIVEQKDATDIQLQITEVNTGIMAVHGKHLVNWLEQLNNSNAQGEYYLTDIIEMAVNEEVSVNTVHAVNEFEVQGVNSKIQLNELERYYQLYQAEELMNLGATLADKSRIDVRGELTLAGNDVYIDINNVFIGAVSLGSNVHIGPNCVIENAIIADGVVIKANSVLENCVVGENSTIGPFARLRPGAELAKGVHIGNFVEVKKATIDEGSKVNHLSYIGDAEIGKFVNVGAGTITCNYDGVNKHKTAIKDGAFIGSGTQLVAPVTVEEGATLGAGTTLSKDAPANALTVTRTKQITLNGWKKPMKD